MRKSIFLLGFLLPLTCLAQDWNYDLETAKKKAAAENKTILLVFSGSDWCARCMELEKTVWQSEAFKAEAKKSWVLLRADFLQKKGNPEPVDVNDMKIILAEKYNRDGFFPYIVLLDKTGKLLGKTGFEEFDTAEEYVTYLRRLAK
ncbi:thiol-disulfide isomerase [Flavobacterium cyanobacteriorum]|uniref:Thiol-disulfide isomerase n=1 Tax=Flavobacterium cyanobacteriorum TaxID=2022802 RepID=A0A255Z3R3_9FLAO|nr:thioredoxin family protein [Flavobacterium cyanobacteriorum]OYQ36082.1 thiol-disulfide isomerase [Flavobacterium cyanobacteriorum]